MNDEEQLNEYVLNDNGKVWQGTYKEPKGYQWFFGQFESVVLPSVMMLIDRSSIPHQDRSDPVKMARCISAIVSTIILYGYIYIRALKSRLFGRYLWCIFCPRLLSTTRHTFYSLDEVENNYIRYSAFGIQ